MTNVFLGYPPEHIMAWIDKYISIEPVDHEKTYIWFEGDTEDAYTEYDWSGEINRQTIVDEGLFNENQSYWPRNPVKVEIGTKVTNIGNGAFASCYDLTTVTIGNSVTNIGNGAFIGCHHLTTVTIGNSVTSIESNAFSYCSHLTTISIPDSVISIGDNAFNSCYELTTVTIGNSVTNIEGNAFAGCYDLTTISILSFTQEQIEANAENWQLGYKYDDNYNLTIYPVTVTAKDGITFVLHQS